MSDGRLSVALADDGGGDAARTVDALLLQQEAPVEQRVAAGGAVEALGRGVPVHLVAVADARLVGPDRSLALVTVLFNHHIQHHRYLFKSCSQQVAGNKKSWSYN